MCFFTKFSCPCQVPWIALVGSFPSDLSVLFPRQRTHAWFKNRSPSAQLHNLGINYRPKRNIEVVRKRIMKRKRETKSLGFIAFDDRKEVILHNKRGKEREMREATSDVIALIWFVTPLSELNIRHIHTFSYSLSSFFAQNESDSDIWKCELLHTRKRDKFFFIFSIIHHLTFYLLTFLFLIPVRFTSPLWANLSFFSLFPFLVEREGKGLCLYFKVNGLFMASWDFFPWENLRFCSPFFPLTLNLLWMNGGETGIEIREWMREEKVESVSPFLEAFMDPFLHFDFDSLHHNNKKKERV